MKITPKKPELSEDFYCSIYLEKSDVDISDVVNYATDHGFTEQTNRHITVIGTQTIDELKKRPELASEVQKLLDSFDWSFTPGKIYLVKKTGTFGEGSTVVENRESIIRLIDMSTMTKFYRKLNILLGTNLPTQFPHITLFTKGDRPNAPWRGIPIPSEAEFNSLLPTKIT